MRILFVAALHHPKQLVAAVEKTPAGQQPPLFPPSMGQHHWELALRGRGHELDVFWRNLPAYTGNDISALREHRHAEGITPQKVITALGNRLPPQLNPDKRTRNKRLIEKAVAFKPDILWIVGDNTVVYPETIQEIKRLTGCLVIYASGTSPIVFSHKVERDAAPLYDLVLVNDFYHGIQWLELGAERAEALPISAANPDFHRPYELTAEEQEHYQCDIAFVGTLLPDHLYSRRVRALEALRDFDLGIWSVHDVPASLRPYVRGSALGEDMLHIMSAAKITFNIHGNFMRYGGNMRLFEAAGVGVCQIADDLPGVHQWFTPGENILTYRSIEDLPGIINQMLQDPEKRKRIGEAGRQHVYANHTYTHRVIAFEKLIGEITS